MPEIVKKTGINRKAWNQRFSRIERKAPRKLTIRDVLDLAHSAVHIQTNPYYGIIRSAY